MPNYPAPICTACAHLSDDVDLDVGPTCAAFPDGIPDAIWPEGFDHRKPFDSDNGVRFKLRPGAEQRLEDYDVSLT